MSKLLGDQLPEEVQQSLDGTDLADKFGQAYLVVTVDEDGIPRPCMLSAGEMLTVNNRAIRLGVWRGSNTAANLRRGSAVLICFVQRNTVLYVKGSPKTLGSLKGIPLDRFEVEVQSVESDIHEGMPVEHGIRFTCEEGRREKVLADWAIAHSALSDG